MKFSVATAVLNADTIRDKYAIELRSKYLDDTVSQIDLENCHAYLPFINSHDHLIGNWYPPAWNKDLYPNAHIWVKNMRNSTTVRERDKIFFNTLPMNFLRGNGKLLALLGGYKNIFSGVTIVQDHAPRQKKSYYDMFPLEVIRNYRQCHSLTMGNFWGDNEAVFEWGATKGKEPFIVHLGEGSDEVTKKEFTLLKELDLLQPNTLLIHGITLSEDEIRECAEIGASICWCAYSNIALIGKTLDIDACQKYGVNVVMGSDSTLSGAVNLIHEFQFSHDKFPHLPLQYLYKMISQNAGQALSLPSKSTQLSEHGNQSLLLINARQADPLENLLKINNNDIVLLVHKGLPLYGHRELLDHFAINDEDYFFYHRDGIERFVIGHPESIMNKINHILGYRKRLPYLPFDIGEDKDKPTEALTVKME